MLMPNNEPSTLLKTYESFVSKYSFNSSSTNYKSQLLVVRCYTTFSGRLSIWMPQHTILHINNCVCYNLFLNLLSKLNIQRTTNNCDL